eukprot:scaffold8594_cov258-Pinguiococcus_pyrenoidosus.AAC.2
MLLSRVQRRGAVGPKYASLIGDRLGRRSIARACFWRHVQFMPRSRVKRRQSYWRSNLSDLNWSNQGHVPNLDAISRFFSEGIFPFVVDVTASPAPSSCGMQSPPAKAIGCHVLLQPAGREISERIQRASEMARPPSHTDAIGYLHL